MLENETSFRLLAFIGSLVLMMIWQAIAPRRETQGKLWSRRLNNLSLVFVTTLILRFLVPVIAVSNVAHLTEQNQWGVFQQFELPLWLIIMSSFILLDCLIYWQHRLFHKVPLLWRLHRVHHSDKDLDASSGIRFHPIELILSILVKSAAVMLLGVPVIAVLIFEICLNVFPIFNHSNVYIAPSLDKKLRLFIVTPDMHRIHHSVFKPETNSNYGFSVSLWDRLFNTYTDEPKLGQKNMVIGLDTIPPSESLSLSSLLLQPFKHFDKQTEKTL